MTDSKIRSDVMVWVDIETFGLNADRDPILEVGFCVTGLDYEIIDGIHKVCVWSDMHESRWLRARVNPFWGDKWVIDTHSKNSLLPEAMASGMQPHEAEEWLCDTLSEEYRGQPICGSSIGFDRAMLEVQMPAFQKLFHYRNIDCSSVKELCRRFNPEVYDKLDQHVGKREAHRVEPDLVDSINEMRYYTDNFMYVTI